jgi:hypothetical protein
VPWNLILVGGAVEQRPSGVAAPLAVASAGEIGCPTRPASALPMAWPMPLPPIIPAPMEPNEPRPPPEPVHELGPSAPVLPRTAPAASM